MEQLNCIKEFSETILNALGSHYKEHIYVSAMCIHLRSTQFLFGNEVIVPIMYQGIQLGYERADIIIYEPVKCVIEFKAQTQSLSKKELNQLIKYKNNMDIQYGILINFGLSVENSFGNEAMLGIVNNLEVLISSGFFGSHYSLKVSVSGLLEPLSPDAHGA